MKHFSRIILVVGLMITIGGSGLVAYAMTPTFSAYPTGTGDTVTISVTGDANSAVWLSYQGTYGYQQQYIGTTGSNGYFSTTISGSSYGIATGSTAYVTVNGQQSTPITWPYQYGNTQTGTVFLNPSTLTLTLGQTGSVAISGAAGPYRQYQSGTGFQSIISGNTIMIIPNAVGSGSVSICPATGSGCATLSVIVNNQGYNTYPTPYPTPYYIPYPTPYPYYTPYPTPYPYPYVTPITFSQTNPTLTIGQSVSIYLSGGSGSYSVAYNSNSSGVSATISGNTLVLYGLANTSAGIVVCSTTNACGGMTVTVNATTPYNNGWTYCSTENQWCYFSGTRTVRYGAGNSFVYRTATNAIYCANSTFGDPLFGTPKQCYYQ